MLLLSSAEAAPFNLQHHATLPTALIIQLPVVSDTRKREFIPSETLAEEVICLKSQSLQEDWD